MGGAERAQKTPTGSKTDVQFQKQEKPAAAISTKRSSNSHYGAVFHPSAFANRSCATQQGAMPMKPSIPTHATHVIKGQGKASEGLAGFALAAAVKLVS